MQINELCGWITWKNKVRMQRYMFESLSIGVLAELADFPHTWIQHFIISVKKTFKFIIRIGITLLCTFQITLQYFILQYSVYSLVLFIAQQFKMKKSLTEITRGGLCNIYKIWTSSTEACVIFIPKIYKLIMTSKSSLFYLQCSSSTQREVLLCFCEATKPNQTRSSSPSGLTEAWFQSAQKKPCLSDDLSSKISAVF